MEQTSAVKFLAFSLRFQTKRRVQRVDKSEITGENAFSGDFFGIEDNHEASKDKKNLFSGISVDLLLVI